MTGIEAKELVFAALEKHLGEANAVDFSEDSYLKDDLGLDSLDIAWIACELNIDNDTSLRSLNTVQDLINIIQQKN